MIKMIEQVVKAERESIKILKKGSIKEDTNDMIKEFYEFCQKRLPNDQTYKESVLFVSLFYFFLENKHLVKWNDNRVWFVDVLILFIIKWIK